MHQENIMQKHGYDQYEEHYQKHVKLLGDIRDITDELELSVNFDEDQLEAKQDTWFAIHFMAHDALLHRLEAQISSVSMDQGTIKSFFSKFNNLLGKK